MPSHVETFGLDRFGRSVAQAVTVDGRGEGDAVFIGTRAAAGVFCEYTTLIDARGRRVAAASLANGARVSEQFFECVTRMPWSDPECLKATFWAALAANAVASTGEGLFLATHGGEMGLRLTTRADIDKSSDWAMGVRSAVEAASPGEVSFDRRELGLLTWYVSALTEQDLPYTLAFDSLQHTSAISVASGEVRSPRDLRGGCAFRLPTKQLTYAVEWDDPSWSPIVSGFVVDRSAS